MSAQVRSTATISTSRKLHQWNQAGPHVLCHVCVHDGLETLSLPDNFSTRSKSNYLFENDYTFEFSKTNDLVFFEDMDLALTTSTLSTVI